MNVGSVMLSVATSAPVVWSFLEIRPLTLYEFLALCVLVITAIVIGKQVACARRAAESAQAAAVATSESARAGMKTAKSAEATATIQLWLEVLALVREPEFYLARGRVFAQEAPVRDWPRSVPDKGQVVSPDGWTRLKEGATEDDARTVCRYMDDVARLIELFRDRLPVQVWSDILCKSWIVLVEFVVKEQKVTHVPEKWQTFLRAGAELFLDVVNRPAWKSLADDATIDRLVNLAEGQTHVTGARAQASSCPSQADMP